jgi:hypothetical protein
MSPNKRFEIYDQLNAILAAMHQLDFEKLGLATHARCCFFLLFKFQAVNSSGFR